MPPPPLGDGEPVTSYTELYSLCSRRRQQATAGSRGERSSREPVSRAEDCLIPHSPGNRGRKPDGCVGNGKRQETATLLHQTETVPHLRDPNNSLHGAVSLEVPLVAETADLANDTHRMQPKAVAWQEQPPHFMEVSPPPAAFKLPPPLPRSETDLEVQKPPHGRGSVRSTSSLQLSQTGWKHHP